MESCGICCHILRKFAETSETDWSIHYSIHLFNSHLTRTPRSSDETALGLAPGNSTVARTAQVRPFFNTCSAGNSILRDGLDKARSRLYRSQILQVNMRWKALAEIYKMHSFAAFSWDPSGWAPLSKLNFLFENRFTKCRLCSKAGNFLFIYFFISFFAEMTFLAGKKTNAKFEIC